MNGNEETGLVEVAGCMLHAGDTLIRAGQAVTRFDPGEKAFAADGGGGLGELCRAIHRQWRTALHARAREAGEQGERLVATAELLAKVAAHYTGTDVTVATRIAAEWTGPEDVRAPYRAVTVRPERGTDR